MYLVKDRFPTNCSFGGIIVAEDLDIIGHLEILVWEQGSHTELRCGWENRLHGSNPRAALCFSKELTCELHRHFITQCIGNDDIHPAAGSFNRFYVMVIEVRLLRDPRKRRVPCKLLMYERCPLIAKRSKEPVFIEPFHVIGNILIEVFQHSAGLLQTLPKCCMELPIEMIHFAVVPGVFLPELCILCDMKASNVGLIKLLHLRDLKEPVIVIADALIPLQRSALFNGRNHVVCFDNVIGDLRHISSQDTLIDAWEAFTIHQFLNIKSIKAFFQTMLFLNGTSNFIELIVVIGMHPLVDQ